MESRRLVQWDERVAVVYVDQLSLWQEFGEAPAVLRWHHAVSTRPYHEGGVIEDRQDASQEASTILSTRAAPSQMSSWTSAPPVRDLRSRGFHIDSIHDPRSTRPRTWGIRRLR